MDNNTRIYPKIYPMTAELIDKSEDDDGKIFKDMRENEELWKKLSDEEQFERMIKIIDGEEL